MEQKSYFELPGFEHVYLEDSYVLEIEVGKNTVEFSLDVVLTEQHPLYRFPQAGEQYCYKHGSLMFPKVVSVGWVTRSSKKYYDLTGNTDYGNIDAFIKTGKRYYLEGDWGKVSIESSLPILTFAD